MPPSDPPPLPVSADDIVATVREPLLVLDADLRVRRANRSFYRSFAVAQAETEGCLVYKLGNGQWDIPALRELLENVLPRHSKFEDFEVTHDFASIGRKVMLLNARRVHVDTTQPPLILLAFEDVTERRRLEDERREIETRFTSLVKNVRDHSIFALDPRGHITSWNVEAERILGFKEAEVLRQHFSIIFTDEDKRDRMPERELSTALSEGRAEDERWHIRRGGERFWALGIVTPIFDARGTHTGFSKILRDMTDRKRTEEALTDSERRFRALATASGAVLYQLSADWSELQPLDGKGLVPSNNAPIRGWFERNVAPSDHAAVREQIANAIKTKTPFVMEHRTNRPDGTVGWTFSSAVPMLDGSGAISEWVGAASDVSARKEAEEGLRRAHDTFYNLIQNNPFGIYVVDGDFRLREVSLGAQKVFAGVPRPLIGRDFAEVMRAIWTEPFAGEVIRLFRHTLDTGEPYASLRTVERRQDTDDVEAYDWRIERVTLPDGRLGVVCYFYDLSERQKWEAALRTSEERLAFSIGAGELGTFFCPMPLGTIIWNAKCKEHFWLPPDAEVDMDRFYAILHPDDRQRTRLAIEQAVFERGVYDIEYRTVAPDGRIRWVRAKGKAYYGQDGQPTRFDGVTFDITEQKHAEDQRQALLEREQAARAEAEQASRMKDDFLATLSHELRTPLNAILGWSQILRSGGSPDPEDIQQGLETIERNARAQTAIIEDLLDMSRIISGKVRLDVQRIDLPPVVQAAVETVRPAAEAKSVRLQVVLDPLAGPVSGDPNRLQQVFWNLLTNAVKFTPKGGRVQVVLERVNSHLEVSVIDTGEGISPDFLPYVFDRFRQSDASTTRRHGGLGLGMAIVKQLVEMHGGSIRAKSAGIGQGATFSVSLPVTVVHAEEEHSPPRRHPSSPTIPMTPSTCNQIEGLKVLVVDDEPDARALVRRVLEDCKAIVIVAASAAEAMELLIVDRPDVLVSDIGMPVEDGFSLMRRVRALPPDQGGDTPAVALTAYARAEDRMNAVVAGFQHHVAKPVEPAELITMIASLSQRRKLS